MMLYKYMSFEVASLVLSKNSICFTYPIHFNDPFDLPRYPQVPEADRFDTRARVRNLGLHMASSQWTKSTGILSLTRTPTNSLMWAHYGGEHRGIVLGIDMRAAGLTAETGNLIPAEFGSVIYVSRRANHPICTDAGGDVLAIGKTHHFPLRHFETLQRLFLHKPLCWSYEEEVRVVKCLADIDSDGSSPSGRFEIVETGGRRRHLFSLAPGSIKEVYLGARLNEETAARFRDDLAARRPEIAVHACRLDYAGLGIAAEPDQPE